MQTESNEMPQHPFEIEINGEFADILFYEDVKKVEATEEKDAHYEYKMYRLSNIRNRPDLESAVEANFEDWFAIAKQKGMPHIDTPKIEDRLSVIEDTVLFLTLGGM